MFVLNALAAIVNRALCPVANEHKTLHGRCVQLRRALESELYTLIDREHALQGAILSRCGNVAEAQKRVEMTRANVRVLGAKYEAAVTALCQYAEHRAYTLDLQHARAVQAL